jgi:hypothetical protein
MTRANTNDQGVTLVSSLLIMALMTAIAIGLSVVILNQVNSTRDINYAVSSYYSADSSLDQGLWIIKQARRDSLTIDQTLDMLGRSGTPITGALTNPLATWKRTAITQNETVKFDLGKEQTASVELYNPNSPDYAEAPQSIEVSWNDPTGIAKVQVSWVGWDASGFLNSGGQSYPAPNCSAGCTRTNIQDPPNQPLRTYLRIKAKDAAVTNLTVKSFKGDGSAIDIPSQIKLTVTGEFPTGTISSKQALSASVPWLIPISGLYSYVLYSEDAIDKP